MSELLEFVTLASWFSGQRFELESEDFIFHIPQRNFPNSCVQQEVFRFFIFPYFVLSWYILPKRLGKTFPKWNQSKQQVLFQRREFLQIKLLWCYLLHVTCKGLHVTCKSYYNLSIKAENY